MRREARILEGPGVTAIVRGNDPKRFREKLERALTQGARGVISIGIAGGLNPALRTGDVVIASAVATAGQRIETDPAWRRRLTMLLPRAGTAMIATAEDIALTPGAKATLFRTTGADAIDLESGIAAELARAHGLPFAVLRVISDETAIGLPAAAAVVLDAAGEVDIAALCLSLVMHPAQLPALMRAASDSRAALRELLRCRDLVGHGLAGPDLG